MEFTDGWKHLNPNINIEYLRPYSFRTETVGPGSQSLSVKPISVEDFDTTHDSWILRKNVTLETVMDYDIFYIDEHPVRNLFCSV